MGVSGGAEALAKLRDNAGCRKAQPSRLKVFVKRPSRYRVVQQHGGRTLNLFQSRRGEQLGLFNGFFRLGGLSGLFVEVVVQEKLRPAVPFRQVEPLEWTERQTHQARMAWLADKIRLARVVGLHFYRGCAQLACLANESHDVAELAARTLGRQCACASGSVLPQTMYGGFARLFAPGSVIASGLAADTPGSRSSPKSPHAMKTSLSLVLQLLGLSLILLALWLLIPVAVNWPDSWLGAVSVAMLVTAGVGLVRRGARLRKAQHEEPAVRSRWNVAMAGAMNSLILVVLVMGAAFAWSLVSASPQ